MTNIRFPVFRGTPSSEYKCQDLRDEKATIEILLDVGRRLNLKGWVLFPTRDETVAAVSRNRAALAELFRVPTPEWDTVQWMWDKRNTYKLAMELKIPIPESWFPADSDDVDRITTPFPLALKPAIKEHFIYTTRVKAWRANDKAELRELLQRADSYGSGGDDRSGPGSRGWQASIRLLRLFQRGKAVGSMVTRRRRQHPYEFGRASTFVETIDLPALESLSKRFLQKIDYYGLVEVEFKLDPRDGQFKLLDVNPRTWGYHSLGVSAGVDFPYLLYADQIGIPLQPCRGKAGVSWIRLLTDFPTGLMDVGSGRLSLRNTSSRCEILTRKPFSAGKIRCQGSWNVPCCPISLFGADSEGFLVLRATRREICHSSRVVSGLVGFHSK